MARIISIFKYASTIDFITFVICLIYCTYTVRTCCTNNPFEEGKMLKQPLFYESLVEGRFNCRWAAVIDRFLKGRRKIRLLRTCSHEWLMLSQLLEWVRKNMAKDISFVLEKIIQNKNTFRKWCCLSVCWLLFSSAEIRSIGHIA